jgi:hypothetical protein
LGEDILLDDDEGDPTEEFASEIEVAEISESIERSSFSNSEVKA